MSKQMEASNAWCVILSGEQRLRCGFKIASYIVARPYAIKIAALIVDFFANCDNMCTTLSCA